MFKDYCKVCGTHSSGSNFSLFIYTFAGKELSEHGKMFAECLFNVYLQEDYPEYLCTVCQLKLLEFYEFRQLALRTHEEFSIRIKDLKFRTDHETSQQLCKIESSISNDALASLTYFETNFNESELSTCLNDKFKHEDDGTSNHKDLDRKYDKIIDMNIKNEEDLSDNKTSIRSKREKVLYRCNLCRLEFSNKKLFKEHKNTHICNLCHKTFTQPEFLRSHMFSHDKPDFMCGTCGKQFKRLQFLRAHETRHTAERNLPCNLCDKLFKFPWDVRKHLRTHTDETKIFECDICGFTCRGKAQLALHIETHSKVNLYKCHICSVEKRTKHSLSSHLNSRHYKAGKYICLFCKAAYGTKSHLVRHVRTHVNNGAINEDDMERYIKLDFIRQRN